jgi:hypothetical protein
MLPLAILLAATALGGCIVEPGHDGYRGGYDHGGYHGDHGGGDHGGDHDSR